MRRVWVFSRWSTGLALAVAIALLALVGSGNNVEASSFSPTFSVKVSDTSPGANGTVTQSVSIPFPDSNFDSFLFFYPSGWTINGDTTGVPNGAVVGSISSVVTLGVLNSPCGGLVLAPVIPMQSATTAQSPTVSFSGGFADISPSNFLRDGVDNYSSYLNTLFPPFLVGAPVARQFGITVVSGVPVQVNLLTLAPGALSFAGFPAALGYPTAAILNDPTSAVPGLITDFCSPFSTAATTLGISANYPVTPANEAGFAVLANPAAPGTHGFGSFATSERDADSDGLENTIDTCPFAVNTDAPTRGPGTFSLVGNPDGDGIDSACDPTPGANSGINADGDGFLNRQDNCPLVFNNDAPGPVQFDSDADGIGDACDPSPAVPDGHNHTALITSPIVIEHEHGVQLSTVGGPKRIREGTTHTYTVAVSNKSATLSQDIQVRLSTSIANPDCSAALVDGGAGPVVKVATAVPPAGKTTVSFDVTYGTCSPDASGTLTDWLVTADACHPGDPAPLGFAGGACPGTDPHGTVDNNPANDAPKTRAIEVKP